jgi:tetratricopeptide (TPR) repeat protein
MPSRCAAGCCGSRSSSRKRRPAFGESRSSIRVSSTHGWIWPTRCGRTARHKKRSILSDKAADRFVGLAPAEAARLQTSRGRAVRDQGKHEEAAEAFGQSYRNSPSLQAFFDLLDALRQSQEYKRALAAIDDYLAEHAPAPLEVLVHKA